ncbi:MAG: transcription antitermination factor NusB [Alphaproteobacteria bacterium]|nr:transcription antitermination factor NusB [Alphaproteobacteria bacterium]
MSAKALQRDMAGDGSARVNRRPATAREVARVGAVQALFQIDFTGAEPDAVLQQFLDQRLAELASAAEVQALDREFFVDVFRGVTSRRQELDGLLGPALAKGWRIERLDTVLRAILRAGTYELLARLDVPAPAVIDAYVNVAHAFFEAKEPGFVNAVLDRLAPKLREHPEGEQETAPG